MLKINQADQAYQLSKQKNKLQKQANFQQALTYQRTITEFEKGLARHNYNQRLAELQNFKTMKKPSHCRTTPNYFIQHFII